MPILMNPAARAGWMRQRNHQRFSADVLDHPPGPNELRERQRREKPLDRQPPNRNQQVGRNYPELVVEPVRATRLLDTSGNAISSAARMRAGIAARDGRDVNLFARRRLVDPGAREPAKQGFSRTPGKRSPAVRFDLPGRLTDQHDARTDGARYDGPDPRPERAALTSGESGFMAFECERGSHATE